jgi:hypothetical protein
MGPYLTAALFCDTFIVERDTDVLSAIRIIDRVSLRFDIPLPHEQVLHLVIGLVGGEMRGDAVLRVRCTSPSGVTLSDLGIPFRFSDHGALSQFAWAFPFSLPELGVYWWDVYLFEQLLTRVPLEVRKTAMNPSSTL